MLLMSGRLCRLSLIDTSCGQASRLSIGILKAKVVEIKAGGGVKVVPINGVDNQRAQTVPQQLVSPTSLDVTGF